jgi:hypothetical protein
MDLRPLQPEFSPTEPITYEAVRQAGEPAQEYIYGLLRDGIHVDFGVIDLTGFPSERIVLGAQPAGQYELQISALDRAPDALVGVISYDQFVVGTPRVERVALVREGAVAAAAPGDPCVSYPGFLAYLRDVNPPLVGPVVDTLGVPSIGPGADDHPTPDFGRSPEDYDTLMALARTYVQSCRCDDLTLLAPTGYLARVGAQSTGWVPGIVPLHEQLPCIELLFCYWLEEGMLVQAMNHVLARFQNRRVVIGDPLARFDVSPLLPLRSLLWNYAENEQRRLTVRRRAAEYQYEYGLALIGKALPPTGSYVERRSGFLPAFHTILHLATIFYRSLDDLTVQPDGFPLYQALRDGHLVMSQGSQNQYGEMAVAARAEMTVMQHVLAQRAMREFLGGRPMTPYPEPWMDRVDSMKAIQGWSDTSILHFWDLAVAGERLALTIRLGNWADPAVNAPEAANWATAFRPVIQRYISAYRTVTGVDLTNGVDTTMPSTLLARRLRDTQRRA